MVEALGWGKAELIADALLGELRRVKSSNATRRYLGKVLAALARLPADIALPRLDQLAEDRSFSPKMRAKLRDAAETIAVR